MRKAQEVELNLKIPTENNSASALPITRMLQNVSLGNGPAGLNCAAKKMSNFISKYRVSKTSITPSYTVEVCLNFVKCIII